MQWQNYFVFLISLSTKVSGKEYRIKLPVIASIIQFQGMIKLRLADSLNRGFSICLVGSCSGRVVVTTRLSFKGLRTLMKQGVMPEMVESGIKLVVVRIVAVVESFGESPGILVTVIRAT